MKADQKFLDEVRKNMTTEEAIRLLKEALSSVGFYNRCTPIAIEYAIDKLERSEQCHGSDH